MSIKSPFLTTRETAEYLNAPLPRTSILVRMNYFPAIQFGTHWRIHKDKLDVWIKENPESLLDLQSPIERKE